MTHNNDYNPRALRLIISLSIGGKDPSDPTILRTNIAGGVNPIPAFLSRIIQPNAALSRTNSADCGTNAGDTMV